MGSRDEVVIIGDKNNHKIGYFDNKLLCTVFYHNFDLNAGIISVNSISLRENALKVFFMWIWLWLDLMKRFMKFIIICANFIEIDFAFFDQNDRSGG